MAKLSYTYELQELEDTQTIKEDGSHATLKIHHSTFKGQPKTAGPYRWRNKWEYIIMTLATTQSLTSYYIFNEGQTNPDNFNIYHILVCYIVVGLPCCYMQVILGQFTHQGIFSLKYMIPLAHGISYSAIIHLFLTCVVTGLTMETYVVYTFISLSPHINWLVCPKRYKDQCWQRGMKCDNACVTDTRKLSAYIYWNYTYMNQTSPIERTELGHPDAMRAWGSVFTWACVYAIYAQGFQKIIKIIRVTFALTWIFTLILLFLLCCTYEIQIAVFSIFTANIHSLYSLQTWRRAADSTIWLMGLGGFSHILYGTLTRPTMQTGSFTCLNTFLNFAFLMLNTLLFGLAELGLLTETHLEVSENSVFFEPSTQFPDIIYIPTVLGFMSTPQIWLSIYFAMICLIALHSIVMNLTVIEQSCSERLPNLLNYIKYITPAICLIGCLCGLIFESKEAYEIYWDLRRYILPFHEHLNVTLLSLVVCYIYGIQRLCDDIHFMNRHPPLKFWKIIWFICPMFLLATSNFYYLDPKGALFMLRVVFAVICYCPIAILGIYGIFSKLKQKRLFSLFLPTTKWGPTDAEDKKKRLLFNPRSETHMDRINFSCQHKCFLENKVLKKIIDNERDIDAMLESSQYHFFKSSDALSLESSIDPKITLNRESTKRTKSIIVLP